MHFPHRPLVADTIPLNITQNYLPCLKRWFLAAILWNDKGGKNSGAYVGQDRLRLSAGTLAQHFPIHSQGCAVGQPHFFQLFISVANRVSFSYDKGLLSLNVFRLLLVHWQEEKRGSADSCRLVATGGGLFFLAVRAALPPFFVLSGPAPVRPVCALCGTVCLSG